MKKIFFTIICTLMVISLVGCAQAGAQLENIDTTKDVNTDSVNVSDYENNLEGLEKYLTELNYIPAKAEATEMMYRVIGAIDGDRYIFNVNNSTITIELYEYDPDNLNDDAKRVLGEIKENGEFHVFEDKSIDNNATYPGIISDNGKYMMIYKDSSDSEANTEHKKSAEEAFKSFHSSNTQNSANNNKENSDSKENSKTDSSDTSAAE